METIVIIGSQACMMPPRTMLTSDLEAVGCNCRICTAPLVPGAVIGITGLTGQSGFSRLPLLVK